MTQIMWSEDVEVAFEEFEAGNEDAMKKYHGDLFFSSCRSNPPGAGAYLV